MQVSWAGARYSANKQKTFNLRQGLFCCIIEISQIYRKYMTYCFREGYSFSISSNAVNQENNVLVQICSMRFFLNTFKMKYNDNFPLLEYHCIYISESQKCCTWNIHIYIWKSYHAVFFLKHLWTQLESQCHNEKLLLIFSLWMWRAGNSGCTGNSFVQATEIHCLGSGKMWSSLAIPERGLTGKGKFYSGSGSFLREIVPYERRVWRNLAYFPSCPKQV